MPDQTFGSIKLAELLLLGSAQIFDILILASENITTLFYFDRHGYFWYKGICKDKVPSRFSQIFINKNENK